MNDKISREELIKIYKIEIQFFDELEEYGLLNIITENNVKYLHISSNSFDKDINISLIFKN